MLRPTTYAQAKWVDRDVLRGVLFDGPRLGRLRGRVGRGGRSGFGGARCVFALRSFWGRVCANFADDGRVLFELGEERADFARADREFIDLGEEFADHAVIPAQIVFSYARRTIFSYMKATKGCDRIAIIQIRNIGKFVRSKIVWHYSVKKKNVSIKNAKRQIMKSENEN